MQENLTKHLTHKKIFKPKSTTDYLNQAFAEDLLKKANTLYQLNETLKDILPNNINQHCWIINWTEKVLTLGIDAAEWLIQIRVCEKRLKKYIVKQINVSSKIKVKYLVRPTMDTVRIQHGALKRLPSKISIQNRKLLQAIANGITDKNLKEAILNLARD